MSYQIVPPNLPVDVTISLEEGLLLPANPLVKHLVLSGMARAQYYHPVTICHHLVEPSHVHMLLYSKDPSLIPGFLERFKTETAHYINRLLGRRKRTVWCEGGCYLPVLTLSSVIEKIAYIYTNPAKDGLEQNIDQYPGVSSWGAYKTGRHKRLVKRVTRDSVPYMPKESYPAHLYRKQVKLLKNAAKESHTLLLQPDAWMDAFELTDEERKGVNHEILERIREKEQEFDKIRVEKRMSVIGAATLRVAHMNTSYVPDRRGKKMWCICDNKDLRVFYIQMVKDIREQAREVFLRWKRGDFSVPFPPGVFPPSMPKLSNMVGAGTYY